SFDVHTSQTESSVCVIKMSRDGVIMEKVSLGDGPINAAYNAIDKITNNLCTELLNYDIHSVSDGNDALGEVTIKLRSGSRTVT
ncbi:MAG TPA: 2-isopropylmalate synthase, partial [Clostridiales bacterium]|nr:2-isopropylmalate synthase [Clostridiales bacterium]